MTHLERMAACGWKEEMKCRSCNGMNLNWTWEDAETKKKRRAKEKKRECIDIIKGEGV